jgi:hypothetical protein
MKLVGRGPLMDADERGSEQDIDITDRCVLCAFASLRLCVEMRDEELTQRRKDAKAQRDFSLRNLKRVGIGFMDVISS